MVRIHATLVRRLALLILVGVTLGLGGCLPGVVWLPDSNGFVYIASDKGKFTRVLHFDLATKKTRVVIDKTVETVQAGLSPDGKRIAVANHRNGERDPSTLQIILFDLQGQELVRSREFAWRKKEPKWAYQFPPAVYWSPKGEHIIVYAENTTGLYDIKAATMKVLPDTIVVAIGGSPVRPDGAGFLVVVGNNPNNQPKYAFIDWQGRSKEMKTPANLLGVEPPGLGAFIMTMVYCPSLHTARWKKKVATVGFSNFELELDTSKLEVRLKQTLEERKVEPIICARYLLAKGVEVRTVFLPDQQFDEKKGEFKLLMRVELLRPGHTKAKILEPVVGLVTVTPSPNGEWLALRCFSEKAQSNDGLGLDWILLVNRKGEVVEVGAAGK